jgi:hypothetical protein
MFELLVSRFCGTFTGAAVVVAFGVACFGVTHAPGQAGGPDYAALMAASDRGDADRQADKRRDPVPFLAFPRGTLGNRSAA